MSKYQNSICKIFLFVLFVSIVCYSSFFLHSSSETHTVSNKKSRNSINIPISAIYFDWEKTIVHAGEDAGRDVVIGNDGYIYITGKLYNQSSGVYDLFIAKYNKSGEQEWNATWNSGSGLETIGYGIDIDFSTQNLYVAGYSKNTSSDVDIILLKYSTDGIYQWNRTWGGNEWDGGYDIVVNDSNSIYITGSTESFDPLGDVVLLKYNSTGHLKWFKTCGGSDTDFSYNLDIDSFGNIYIAGHTSSFGTATSNGYLIKYNKTGGFEWNKTWGGDLADDFYDLTIDSNGDIIIAGNTKSYSKGGYDISLLKFNSTGELQYNITWGDDQNDYCYSIALDSNNNTYIAGYTMSYDGTDRDICLVKINSTGGFQWSKIRESTTEDFGYGISTDLADNNTIYVTGKANNEICVLKFSQLPDAFTLSSNIPSGIDSDGNFTLTWSKALDANNYTLYQYDKPITKINWSLIRLDKWNTNRTFEVKNLAKGVYYFLVEAHNNYGNTTSNCIEIRIIYPPENFVLNDHPDNPDGDGKINLTWGIATDSDNYSIYSHTNFIHKIENNGTLVVEGLINNSFLIQDLTNQDIYYVAIAYNLGGKKQSNCIQVVVRRIPDNFSLTSTATNPDTDGKFDLVWIRSEFTHNYTIYYSSSFIDKIDDDNVKILLDQYEPEFVWPSYKYNAEGWESGTYYFMVVAVNQYGNFSSNCINVVIKIPLIPEEGDSKDRKRDDSNWFEELAVYIAPSIFIVCLAVLIGVYWYRKKIFKRKYSTKSHFFFKYNKQYKIQNLDLKIIRRY
ncbi:MAG: SBBP repeat-containing protein [Candidatus Hodarchaeota archaeon]